ncbi:MAG: hypothetical protein WC389_21590 [Lutibacter sp.]|jgi:hypothetical protein
MSRIRALKPDFFKDEDLATLPYEARLLYQGLWCKADKSGRLEDRPKYLKAEIFPYDNINIEKFLILLCQPNLQDRPEKVFIRRYTVNDRKYIDIPEFLKHQSPHNTEKESVLPSFNGVLTVSNALENNGTQVTHSPKSINPKSIKEEKKKYLDSVYLTEQEYKKLQEALGQKSLDEAIEKLDYSITVKSGKYKDHYKTILNWNKRGFLNGNTTNNKGFKANSNRFDNNNRQLTPGAAEELEQAVEVWKQKTALRDAGKIPG